MKIKKLFSIAAAASLFFAGCGKTDDPVVREPLPDVTISGSTIENVVVKLSKAYKSEVSVEVISDQADFTVKSPVTIEAGKTSANVVITAKEGLAAGTYEPTVSIKSAKDANVGKAASVKLSYVVADTEPENPGGGEGENPGGGEGENPGGGEGENPGGGEGENPGGGETTTGKVAVLDGQYFPYTWDASVAVQDEITMEAWFNANSFSGGNDKIYTIMGTEGIFLLRFEEAKLNLVYGGTKNTVNNEYAEKKITYDTNIPTGEWHHVAATYKNGGDVILYLDGKSVATGIAETHGIELNGVGANWILPFTFYVGVSSNRRVWKGSLAEVRVWNKVRTEAEIKDSMNKSLSSGTGLMASWPINEGSGNNLADATGNGHNLTATGGDVSWTNAERPF